jgi:hypothetical protein
MAKKEWVYTKLRRKSLEDKARPRHQLYVKLGKEVYERTHK